MHAYVHICAYLCTHIGTINLLDYYVDQDKASTDPQMLVLRCLKKPTRKNGGGGVNNRSGSPDPDSEQGMLVTS